MKKTLTIIFLLVFLSSVVFAKEAIFYPDNSTVDLQCLRVKSGETIGNECYDVVLRADGLGVVSVSAPFTAAKENTDQTFDVNTFVLSIPYLKLGDTAYYINLKFDPNTGLLTVESYGISTITPDDSSGNNGNNNSGGVVGSCFVDTSELTHSSLCQEANAGCDASEAKHACDIIKGQWRAGVSCSEGDLGSCYYIPNSNGCTLNQEYYDAGILDMYISLGQSTSIVYEGMQDACKNLGGIYERSTE